jgi:polysaccharide chain length determinant protein (PEP-CTERM system associated)
MVYGFARAAWRRRRMAVLAAWAMALAAWSVTLMLKDRYEASARVLVDVQTPLQPVLKGIAIEADYASQVARVREILLSRPEIEAVARKTNLDKDVGDSRAEMEELVTKLGKEIAVFSTAAGGDASPNRAPTESIYNIVYRHNDREKSVEVVRELLRSFDEGTAQGDREGMKEAQDFLDTRIEEARKKLEEQEKILADFQKRNLNVLPSQGGDYFARYAQERADLQQAETNLTVALARQRELNEQLANTPKYLVGTSETGVPNVTLRRQEAEKKLEELLLVYTEKNRDVIALRKTIEELREKEREELADLQSGGEGSGDTAKTLNPQWQQISAALGGFRGDIAAIRAAIGQHQKKISQLNGQLDQTPEIQQQLAELTRNYNVDKEQYEKLRERKQEANISGEATKAGIARFEILDPPRASPTPVWPSRPMFILGGLVAALGCGLALAMLPQVLAPTISDVATLERQFGLPVLGTVSALRDASIAHRERYAIRNTVFAVGALVVLAGFLVVFSGRIAAAIQH